MDRATRYGATENRDVIRDWQSAHVTNKCDSLSAFESEYLTLLQYSYIPEFLRCRSDPATFADFYRGHVLMQKLSGLLGQLADVTQFVTRKVQNELQGIVEHFWTLGKAWEKANIKNRLGNPSTCFEDVENHVGLRVLQPSEGQFKTYVNI